MKEALLISLMLLAAPRICNAQNRPAGACNLPDAGFDAAFQGQPVFAVTRVNVSAWMGCESPKGCIQLSSAAGSPVLVFNTQAQWTCGYSEDAHGAGPVWLHSTDLRPIHIDPNPSRSAWIGAWTQGGNRIRINSAKNGELHIRGNAVWHGVKGVEHYGEVDDVASPNGNRLHLGSGGSEACVVDMMLLGNFILAKDNTQCGGMNVRFQGFWRRAAPH